MPSTSSSQHVPASVGAARARTATNLISVSSLQRADGFHSQPGTGQLRRAAPQQNPSIPGTGNVLALNRWNLRNGAPGLGAASAAVPRCNMIHPAPGRAGVQQLGPSMTSRLCSSPPALVVLALVAVVEVENVRIVASAGAF
ncbi:hypothetical protein Purlil1_11134 [Purpureocillium lilacinum]|uniref:Uncharacterized protein n=1 Tax=Purpureocillium lilacinum TaxID=33203 RepID=A0ABR0BL87_PURLI|nr:hypothetical protein Purlil1_11134 [Purpureocillium lilacinum]